MAFTVFKYGDPKISNASFLTFVAMIGFSLGGGAAGNYGWCG